MASSAKVEPIHTGLENQKKIELTPAARRPHAMRLQTYGPPSSGKAAPSSATKRP